MGPSRASAAPITAACLSARSLNTRASSFCSSEPASTPSMYLNTTRVVIVGCRMTEQEIVIPPDVMNVNTVQDAAARLRAALVRARGEETASVVKARADLAGWIDHARTERLKQCRRQIVCFSGGNDSTAMIIAMRDRGERIDGLLVTPTGNELPAVWQHWNMIADMVSAPVIVPPGPTLAQAIESQNALPNFRMRWCTRLIKIVPAIAFAMANSDAILCVGLRADEEEREGIISRSVDTRFPLREYGMTLADVRGLLECRGIVVPPRTDCAVCFWQRLAEWYELWCDHPDKWAEGERWEERTGHTFRSPGRDTWPVAMKDLRARFEAGDKPERSLKMLAKSREVEGETCRMCSM